jgi:hypothetical protein
MVHDNCLEIVIMTRDRNDYLLRAIRAIDRIDFGRCVHKVVSDNYQNIPVSPLMIGTNWILRTRSQELSAIDHFQSIIKNSSSKWLLVTHDDDELTEDFGLFFQRHSMNENVRVISGITENLDHRGEKILDLGYILRLKKSRVLGKEIFSSNDFLKMQFRVGSIFPFSGIIFQRSLLDVAKIENLSEYGYAIDYYFALLLCLEPSRLPNLISYNTSAPVLRYYRHGNQWSSEINMKYMLQGESLLCRLFALKEQPDLVNHRVLLRTFVEILNSRSLAKQINLVELDDKIKSRVSELNLRGFWHLAFYVANRATGKFLLFSQVIIKGADKLSWLLRNLYNKIS